VRGRGEIPKEWLYPTEANSNAETNPLLRSRVLLADAVRNGVDPPEELEEDVLLKGKVHICFGDAGSGKTMLALKFLVNAIERGETVLYLDTENMYRIVSERLEALGVDPDKLDEQLYYLPSPNMPGDTKAAAEYAAMLDEVKPSLIVFDSWINFLAGAGLSENENVDVAHWAVAYLHPARDRDIVVLVLDHIPHDGNHARGATRKKDEADVSWRIHKTKNFDRDTVGQITLTLVKDREGWLPATVTYSIGGTVDGFICERSAGTFEPDATNGGLKPSHEATLEALRILGETGAKEWKKAASVGPFNVSRSSFYRAKELLIGMGLVVEDNKQFKVVCPTSPKTSHGTVVGRFQNRPTSPTPLKGWDAGTKRETADELDPKVSGNPSSQRPLTEWQIARVVELRRDGWAEEAALAQVLGEEL
jgi:hypothetical protein